MSIRHFTPKRRRRGLSMRAKSALYLSLFVVIFLQILYPLTHGRVLDVIIVATVVCGAIAMLIHAQLAYGRAYATRFFFATFFFSAAIELLGVHTGWPFGVYTYDPSLGFAILDLPLVVPCAWIMMAHPVLIAARRVTQTWVFLYGGLLLASWDYFLDPLMVSAGKWHWQEITSHLPGTPDIPLINFFGWLLAGFALIGALNTILPHERRKESANNTVISIFLMWTLFSTVVGNLFFFDRPSLAIYSLILFGGLLAPYFFKSTLGES